ncbi:tetratricopeptide repeat protein [Candidatus Saccharibacteria bacterium]|nr:tetratricopeptide repeat protein [Candidatus Saccharibacteria bacterium]
MLGVLFILILVLYLLFFYPIVKVKADLPEEKDSRYTQQMKKLWSVAQDSMRQRKPLRAEKALLTILKFDEKNAAAYNRLGILYAKEQKYDEAIECFEIAQSLDNNASSLHNAGLIYLETGAFEKAAIAFEQAIKLEGDVPARYIALAKSYENLGRKKDALENLESAYSLSPTLTTLRQILSLHESSGDAEAVAATNARIEAQMAANAKARASRTKTAKRGTARARTRLVRKVSRPTIKSSTRKTASTPRQTSTTPRKTSSASIARKTSPTSAARKASAISTTPKRSVSTQTTIRHASPRRVSVRTARHTTASKSSKGRNLVQ